MNKHTYPHDYHDYPHNVPLINSLLHNARDYKIFYLNSITQIQYNSGYCDYYKLTP